MLATTPSFPSTREASPRITLGEMATDFVGTEREDLRAMVAKSSKTVSEDGYVFTSLLFING
jgi:hypothetical protein